ncbi:MAG: archaellin/type IV pilin N-terminal domain-containing protein [Candidatus Bathyarchaeia archaeon]
MGVGDRRGVSPVIATIIIVAVAIVMSLAVAYWMLGLGGAFTRYEKLEFQSAYVDIGTNNTDTIFNVTIRLKNTGSADATLDMILLNGKPYDSYKDSDEVSIHNASDTNLKKISDLNDVTIKPGESFTLLIYLKKATESGGIWKSGMTLEIMVQTVAGRQYPKSIMLP